MNADSISIISVQENDFDDISKENARKTGNRTDPLNVPARSANGISVTKEHFVTYKVENGEKPENSFGSKDTCKALALLFLTIVVTLVFNIPWTLIPRTNSIIYQNHWFEMALFTPIYWILVTGTDMLNLTI